MNDLPAGWYDDGSGSQRWWDGSAWTEIVPPTAQRASNPESPQQEAAPTETTPKRWSRSAKVGVVAVSLALIAAAGGAALWWPTDNRASTSLAKCSRAKFSIVAGTTKFGLVSGMTTDRAGNLYVANQKGYVEKITPSGAISVVAGNGTNAAPIPGPATSSPMMPTGVAVDTSGNLYIADNDEYTFHSYLEKVTPDGTLSVIAGGAARTVNAPPTTLSSLMPQGVAVDEVGNIYVADAGGYLVKVTPAGTMSVIAGTGRWGEPVPGQAKFSPIEVTALAVDPSGNVYATDTINGNNQGYVVKVTPAGTLSVIAGNGKSGGLRVGPATSTPLYPIGIALNSAGDIFVSSYWVDQNFHTVQSYVARITSSQTLSVLAGNGTTGELKSGSALSTGMAPFALAVDRHQNVYVADTGRLVAKLTCSH